MTRQRGIIRRPPIQVDRTTWLVMRSDPSIPAAVIRLITVTDRRTHEVFERYRVTTWTLDPDREERRLLGYFLDLDSADFAVRNEIPPLAGRCAGPPRGGRADLP